MSNESVERRMQNYVMFPLIRWLSLSSLELVTVLVDANPIKKSISRSKIEPIDPDFNLYKMI